jgi:hypothetical protein
MILIINPNGFSQHHENETRKHHFQSNYIGILAGATTKLEKEGTHFTLGADYIRKFPHTGRWGISIFGEVIFEEHTEWLFGIPVYYKFYKNLLIRTGPGIEIIQEEVNNESAHNSTSEHHETISRTEFLWRIGILYEFEIGSLFIAPSVDVDFERSTTAVVWGVNFGMGF